jgi:hypothetical protein
VDGTITDLASPEAVTEISTGTPGWGLRGSMHSSSRRSGGPAGQVMTAWNGSIAVMRSKGEVGIVSLRFKFA